MVDIGEISFGTDASDRFEIADAIYDAFDRSTFSCAHDTSKRSGSTASLVSVSPAGMAGFVRGRFYADVTAIMSNVSGTSVGVSTGASVTK